MADYPDWVLAHKKKGTYINRVGDKYYLYAAHSERVPGTDKVRRVSDGYIGRITERDGLIPAKRKLSGDIYVYEYGLSETVLRLCGRIRTGLKREFKANADLVMASGVLLFMYGRAAPELYETSWLSLAMPGLDIEGGLTDKQRVGAERACRMAKDRMAARFGDELQAAMELLPLVRKVRMGDEGRLAAMPARVVAFCEKHSIEFKEGM